MPKNDRSSIGRPRTPPIRALLLKISELNISAMARVATARLVPRVRTAGRATTRPTRVVTTMQPRSASSNGQPLTETSRATIHAPNPARANWHSDS
jgi:hypothetical protein